MVAQLEHQAEWDEIDRAAEREGIAVTRLQRRTGYAPASPAELHNRHPEAGRHIAYRRAAAIEAFDRLFREGTSQRMRLYSTRGDFKRRRREAELRKRDVAIGDKLRELPPEEARKAFKMMREVS